MSAPANATGGFKDAFGRLIQTVFAPAAVQKQITTKAEVKTAGVIEAHEDKVIVLVFLDQTTTSKDTKTDRLDGSRIRVTMVQVRDTWLIADLTPV